MCDKYIIMNHENQTSELSEQGKLAAILYNHQRLAKNKDLTNFASEVAAGRVAFIEEPQQSKLPEGVVIEKVLKDGVLDFTKVEVSSDDINQTIRYIIDRFDIRSIHTLELESALGELPEEIFNLIGLEYILAEGCNITTIPDSIGKLTNLLVLDLSINELTELPNSILKLTKLLNLNLNENNIEDVRLISELRWIEGLDISSNRISEIPEEFKQLTNLNWLYLKGNDFSNVPEVLYKMTNLSYLSLDIDMIETAKSINNYSTFSRNFELI
jgi:Leucine-rich repeat (LRR) protein